MNENGIEKWPPEVSIITEGIKPFSYYAVFVRTLIVRDKAYNSEDIQSAASEIGVYRGSVLKLGLLKYESFVGFRMIFCRPIRINRQLTY